jgi:hypothetical protein
MDFFWSLFSSRSKCRLYARVDQSGICRAFKQCSQPPLGHGWVEIVEQNLAWLDQPLPISARSTGRTRQPETRQLRIA